MKRYFTPVRIVFWVLMTGIVAIICFLAFDHITHPRNQAGFGQLSHCRQSQLTLQQVVRSWQLRQDLKPGDPILWEEIIGPGENSLISKKPVCPIQGDFILATTIPERGTQVARCSHPEHQHQDTVDW